MTVQELINSLNRFDKDMTVVFSSCGQKFSVDGVVHHTVVNLTDPEEARLGVANREEVAMIW